jgi:hypothetical protein
MISENLAKQNQKIGYYKLVIIISISLVAVWVLLTIQSAVNQNFEDKKAQAASKAISPDFDLETLNSLQDKYNPTELELRKVNPYTETSTVEPSPNPVYFLEETNQEASGSSSSTESTESSNSANLNL